MDHLSGAGQALMEVVAERLLAEAKSNETLLDKAKRCCQSNGNSSPRGRGKPKPNSRLGEDCLPGGQCGGSSLLVDCPADEMAFLSEVVVD